MREPGELKRSSLLLENIFEFRIALPFIQMEYLGFYGEGEEFMIRVFFPFVRPYVGEQCIFIGQFHTDFVLWPLTSKVKFDLWGQNKSFKVK